METGQKARLDQKKPLFFFCATSGRKRHGSSTVGGILASTSEAAIREAIQAHLPEDGREGEGGRGKEGRREEREQIYERRRRWRRRRRTVGGALHAHRV